MASSQPSYKWSMVVDIDRCTGCQACVVACQAENNIPINTEAIFRQHRAIEWIRIERYWEGEFPQGRARFIPILCHHCNSAPCEPVCPVYATVHNEEGLNLQVYARCIGVRLCANNCPYQIRFFNFWQPVWPPSLRNALNPQVTVRTRGIIEKCTFCLQRINGAKKLARRQRREVRDGEVQPACVQTCPTGALTFGNILDEKSQVYLKAKDPRHYKLFEELGTEPNVIYLMKVDTHGLG